MNFSAETSTATTTRLRSLQSSATSLPMSSSSMINTCTTNPSHNSTTTTILNSVNTAKSIFNNINNYRIISTPTAFQKANYNHNNSINHHPKKKPTTANQLSNNSSSPIIEQTAALMMLSSSGKTGTRDRATAIGGEIEPLLPSSVSTSATMSPMHETYNANDKIIQIGLHNQNNNNNNNNNNYNNININSNNRNTNSIEKNNDNSDIIGITMVDCTDNSNQHSHRLNNGNFNLNQNDGDSNEESSSLLITPENMIIRTQQTPITWKNVIILNFLSFLFVSLMMIVNLLVISIIHERVPMDQPHLPDIAFDILPDHRHFLDIAEYVIVIQTFCISVLLFFHKYRSTILRRICLIMGIIYFFRAICLISTQLPLASKNYYCSPQLKNSSAYENITALEFIDIIFSRVFYMSLGMGLSINGHHTFCGDYIFSGHTVILVLTYLIQQEYLLPTRRRTLAWKCVNLIQITMTVTSVICILIARGHYFIDIIIAYFATTRIFWIYHTLCHCTQTQLKSNTKYLKRVWWWPLFVYLENIQIINSIPTSMMANNHYHTSHHHHHSKNDEHHRYNDNNQVQRIFEWPLPWPKSFARRSKHHRSHQFTA